MASTNKNIKKHQQCFKIILLFLSLIYLVGCTPIPQNIQLPQDYWQHHKKKKVVVAVTKAPVPQVYKIGQQGLVEFAINTVMNTNLDKYLEKNDLTWYYDLTTDFTDRLNQRKVFSIPYRDQTLKLEKEKYAEFATKLSGDELLIIKLKAVGVARNYYSFIPTSEPKAYCVLLGKLVNVKTNTVLWRQQSLISMPIEGEWDQPPNYPNITKAIKLTVASAKQELLDSFFSDH